MMRVEKHNFAIGSFNVGGFKKRPEKVLDVFEKVKFLDICILQETHYKHVSDTLYFNSIFESNFNVFHSLAKSRCTGICIIFSNKIIVDGSMQIFEIVGRCLAFRIPIDDNYIILCGLYCPAPKNLREPFFHNVMENMDRSIYVSGVC